MEALNKLTRDMAKAASTLNRDEARYLVDTYYQIQDLRIATKNQCKSIDNRYFNGKPIEPHETLEFFSDNFEIIEKNIKRSLKKYVESQPIGEWLLSICGIGEVLAAGLIANIDISKVQTAGQIQSFAGLNPNAVWNKGEKRPFNARLKTLCWKIGESFVKVSNNEKDVYGKLYKIRKEYETKKNDLLEYSDQADELAKKFKKSTESYKYYSNHMLPPAHIHSRAKRYAVKIFLSHLFSVWYELENHEKPPKPYAIAILNHAHEIPIPNYDLIMDKFLN